MNKLILSTENNEYDKEFLIDKETLTIGRRSSNDICIDSLSISGKHCQIITLLNHAYLKDLGSTNGTYVNGISVTKHALKNDDIIGIGKHQLRFQQDEIIESTLSEAERTALESMLSGVCSAQLIQLNGNKEKMKLNKGLTIIGTPGEQVAAISMRSKGIVISHISGGERKQHPLINGEDIGQNVYLLSNKDIIEVAGIKYQLCIER